MEALHVAAFSRARRHLVCAQHAAKNVDHVGGDGYDEAILASAIGIGEKLRVDMKTRSAYVLS